MAIFKKIFIGLMFVSSLILEAQILPPIQAYPPEVYGADNQNWSVAQTENKFIYIANNKGLLEFNGEKWQLYLSPNGKLRSVKVINDIVYTGSYKEFGYWENNEFGSLEYTSLSKKLNIDFLDDEEFWNIISIDNWILFQSLKRIYIYNITDKSYSIINSKSVIYKMFEVDNTIYFQKIKEGLYKIEKGKSKLVSNDKVFKNKYLVNVFSLNDKLLIETEDDGFYTLNSKNKIHKWNIPANDFISTKSVYRSKKLKSGGYLLGTRSNGVFHLNTNGNIDYTLNFSNGLLNNSIHEIFEDSENNIWLALENGINCINVKSPFSFYNDVEGKIGTTYASAIYQDYLYLGTNQGLFYKPIKNKASKFTFVKGTEGPVWSLFNYNGTLFCGHNLGTFVINDGKVKNKIDVNGTWGLTQVSKDKDVLLQGNYDGLSIIENKKGNWSLRNKIKGFNTSSKFFEIIEDNIFISHEYKGVYKLKIDNTLSKIVETTQDSTVKKGIYSSLVKHNNKILYTYKDGVYKYEEALGKFIRDTLISELFKKEEFTSGKLISNKNNNVLWGFSKKKLNYLIPGKFSSKPTILSLPFSESLPHGLTGSENITYLNNQNYLIGTSDGYIILDLGKVKHKSYKISINSIVVSNQNDREFYLVNSSKHGNFENKHNNIELNCSVPEYSKYLDTEYQYKLEGVHLNWSSWSSSSTIRFENISYGDYQLKVRARVGLTLTNNTETYSFSIERPWYFTKFIIACYIITIILLIFITHNIYKRYYRKQRERLMKRTERELELKELENKQQLMRFNNEKLRQDIDSKSRELGISTMSIIKKNEFLGSLKKELQNINDTNQLKNVIKIIDKNLNNTDDWNLFEEAFNNADKDFLKKIKRMHPELTTNDLRLCTYLRLNLSSKEIAPLLNISTRSVEVKRYRLRKKLNLAHESSLSDYILEI